MFWLLAKTSCKNLMIIYVSQIQGKKGQFWSLMERIAFDWLYTINIFLTFAFIVVPSYKFFF
jgi:hypothetical protein